uniref:Reactive oxygen species modulator 1 n=2 Tax=Sinocyclocheilus grahami TaxID=75366 RepID=A0A672Q661_SINGR
MDRRSPAALTESRWACMLLKYKVLSSFQMPVTVGPYGQTQPGCFDRVKMGFMMGFAVGMAAGAMFGTFSCLRIGMRGRELMGGVGKTMMQSGGTFGTFMAIGMGIRC